MRVGVFTPLLSQLPLPAVLKKLKSYNIETVELGTGNYPGDAHCKLTMLDDHSALAEFQKILKDHGVTISALSCHGNALHPDPARAKKDREVSRKTILLAEKLGIPVVVDFSGCPGDSPHATAPNWVTCPWPPDYLKVLDWQWNEVVTPYWREHGKFAADHGVKIAIEMHPGFVVYSPETMLKLRAIAGPTIGCNLDPSHMFWQNIDPIAAVRILKDAIFYVHAKDTQIYSANLPRTACSTPNPTPTRPPAAGSSAPAATVTAPSGGRNSSLPCACSDTITCSPSSTKTACSRPEEGLAKAASFLNDLVIKEQPTAAWWV